MCVSGSKLPLVILVKGKTQRAIESYGKQIFPVQFIISQSGWSDFEVMKLYLTWLISVHGSDDFSLIMDQYPSHLKLSSYITESQLRIKVLFVPKGATGVLQPLDRKIFGILKAKGNSKWITFYNNQNGITPTKEESLRILLESWAEIDEKSILKSWDYTKLSANDDIEPPTDPLDQNYHYSKNDNDD